MKITIIGILVLSLIIIIIGLSAQTGKRYDKIKDRVQQELNIDEEKADSTIKIVQRFLKKSRDIRADTIMKEEDKATALRQERKQDVAVLKTFLSDQQIKKLQTLLRNYKAKKQQNQNNSDTSLKKYYF